MIGEPEARRGRSNPRLAEVGVNHAVYVTILIFDTTLAVRNTPPPSLSNHQSDLFLHAFLKNCYFLFIWLFSYIDIIAIMIIIISIIIIIYIFASIAKVFFFVLSLYIFGYWSNMRLK